jgi:Xaa-Pro aminopeptidase
VCSKYSDSTFYEIIKNGSIKKVSYSMSIRTEDPIMALSLDISGRKLDDGVGESPFSREEYRERLAHVRHEMDRAQIDLLLVTAPDDMCYLHNYQATWYRAHATTQWPPFAITAVHREREHPIHFDYEGERYLLREHSKPIIVTRAYSRALTTSGGMNSALPFRRTGWVSSTLQRASKRPAFLKTAWSPTMRAIAVSA